jgi:FKBP-type peptidyl-prolyl cis-trans isomerase SlyD
MQIANDSVVSIDYELKNDAGLVLDASAEDSPLVYLHGHRNLISGLEQALEGKSAGDSLEVRIAPADAYGELNEALRQSVPRDRFQGVDQLEVGMQFQASTDQGPISVRIVAVEDEQVTVDGNHPLAGEHLNFAVTVRDVRVAEESEIAHGHVHGKGGVEH